MVQVHAPRSVFLDYPLGRQCGPAHNADLQRKILQDTLTILTSATGPGTIVDLAYEWSESFTWEAYRGDIEAMLREEGASNRPSERVGGSALHFSKRIQ
jgi:hypothetical protein